MRAIYNRQYKTISFYTGVKLNIGNGDGSDTGKGWRY